MDSKYNQNQEPAGYSLGGAYRALVALGAGLLLAATVGCNNNNTTIVYDDCAPKPVPSCVAPKPEVRKTRDHRHITRHTIEDGVKVEVDVDVDVNVTGTHPRKAGCWWDARSH
jgi:hypothetical protein